MDLPSSCWWTPNLSPEYQAHRINNLSNCSKNCAAYGWNHITIHPQLLKSLPRIHSTLPQLCYQNPMISTSGQGYSLLLLSPLPWFGIITFPHPDCSDSPHLSGLPTLPHWPTLLKIFSLSLCPSSPLSFSLKQQNPQSNQPNKMNVMIAFNL